MPITQNEAFISAMPPPGTTIPRATFASTSGRQMSVAPSRPQFAGYREHYVTTTNQTVHATQDQSFSHTGNGSSVVLDDGRRVGSVVDNVNQSRATPADLGVTSDFLDAVISDTRRTSSSPAVASATERSSRASSVHERELAVMFEETERGIMEAFDNAQQVLR